MGDNDREAFLRAIETSDWRDDTPRLVYADWLDERGEHEEAQRQRSYKASREWLEDFASQCGDNDPMYHTRWDVFSHRTTGLDYHSEEYQRLLIEAQDEKDASRVPITFEDVVRAGKEFLETGGDEVFIQRGDDKARDLMHNEDTKALYWRHWSVVTGITPVFPKYQYLDGEEEVLDSPFSCSC